MDHTHWNATTQRKARVLLLNDGRTITAEDVSMLQALYSRDPNSIDTHLEKVNKSGSGKFMEQFYVGYGHKSIGDCGTMTLFIEGVSMLAAKALQEGQLYNGQEVSTRYVNFEHQPFLTAFADANPKETLVLNALREFYVTNLPLVEAHLRNQFPIRETDKPADYNKAIKARAFDVMRGFLPAGAATSLSWTGNLRQFSDRLACLRHHPLVEIREIAHAIQEVLEKGAPHSFGQKKYPEQEAFTQEWMKANAYQRTKDCPNFEFTVEHIDTALFNKLSPLFKMRPFKTEIPPHVNAMGSFRCRMLLDFGSYRDIQRHRSIVQLPPLLTVDYGFEPWYLEQLPENVRVNAERFLHDLEHTLRSSHTTIREDLQYLIPMGYRVPLEMVGGVSAWIYVAEIRSATTVHPTLRVKAHMMAENIKKVLGPDSIRLPPFDEALSRFDVRRGTQDIVEKKN